MQNTKFYQIVAENELEQANIVSPIAILTTKTISNTKSIKALIENNPKTEFWLAIPKMERETIVVANELGFKNIITPPINEETIRNHFERNIADTVSAPTLKKLEPLSDTKIMIVDDNIMNIQLLEEVLDGLHIELETFNKPQLALEKIATEEYDLFLLDVLMPDISGFELAQAIKNSKLNKNTPIIFMSALGDNEYKITGFKTGGSHYIEKPYDVGLVKLQIYNILKEERNKKQHHRSKDKMLAMITHDLKTPISAEITALQLLLRNKLGKLNDPQQEIIEDILSSAKFLKTMTDNILCDYKHKSDNIELKLENCDFVQIIETTIKETKYLLEDKQLKLIFNNSLGTAPINIDVIEIKRVLNNLIGNATDYAPPNSEITIKLIEDKNEYICTISDKGIGINLENPNDIFECNLTLAKNNKRIGFGLGLFISKNIITAHGGKISAESVTNNGTSITFSLPK